MNRRQLLKSSTWRCHFSVGIKDWSANMIEDCSPLFSEYTWTEAKFIRTTETTKYETQSHIEPLVLLMGYSLLVSWGHMKMVIFAPRKLGPDENKLYEDL